MGAKVSLLGAEHSSLRRALLEATKLRFPASAAHFIISTPRPCEAHASSHAACVVCNRGSLDHPARPTLEKSTPIKNPNLSARAPFFLSLFFFKPPSSDKSLFEAHTRRELCSFTHFALGESPRTPTFVSSWNRSWAAETRRHRSTAADLGQARSLSVPQPAHPTTPKPAPLSLPLFQFLDPSRRPERPYGRRYESALSWFCPGRRGSGSVGMGGWRWVCLLLVGSGLGPSRPAREISS